MTAFRWTAIGLGFAFCVSSAAAQSDLQVFGELRMRGEARVNSDFNSDREDGTAFVLNRLRLGLERPLGGGFRVSVILQDSRLWGEEGSTLNPLNKVDLHQAYLQWDRIGGLPLSVRAGRQSISLGGERLVSSYDWHNVGRAFDAARVVIGEPGRRLDVWLAQVRDHNAPTVSRNQEFAGAYLSTTLPASIGFDVYALVLSDRRNFNPQPGEEEHLNIYTYGVRAYRPKGEGLDYDLEAAYQTGNRGPLDISAFGLAVEAGYRFAGFGTPWIGAGYTYGSGDSDPGDAKSETLANLFPNVHRYLGSIDYASWSNISTAHVAAELNPIRSVTIGVDFHLLSLADGNDAWYRGEGFTIGSPREVYRRAVPGASRSLGREIDLRLVYRHADGVRVLLGFSQFFIGDFVRDSGGGRADDSSWGYLSVAAEF